MPNSSTSENSESGLSSVSEQNEISSIKVSISDSETPISSEQSTPSSYSSSGSISGFVSVSVSGSESESESVSVSVSGSRSGSDSQSFSSRSEETNNKSNNQLKTDHLNKAYKKEVKLTKELKARYYKLQRQLEKNKQEIKHHIMTKKTIQQYEKEYQEKYKELVKRFQKKKNKFERKKKNSIKILEELKNNNNPIIEKLENVQNQLNNENKECKLLRKKLDHEKFELEKLLKNRESKKQDQTTPKKKKYTQIVKTQNVNVQNENNNQNQNENENQNQKQNQNQIKQVLVLDENNTTTNNCKAFVDYLKFKINDDFDETDKDYVDSISKSNNIWTFELSDILFKRMELVRMCYKETMTLINKIENNSLILEKDIDEKFLENMSNEVLEEFLEEKLTKSEISQTLQAFLKFQKDIVQHLIVTLKFFIIVYILNYNCQFDSTLDFNPSKHTCIGEDPESVEEDDPILKLFPYLIYQNQNLIKKAIVKSMI
ncbi:p17/29c-like protein [Anaeramoeba flamelloides]|uniref:P17/29c-like protein n=1 Tax=Anaeramoeba flamelloides TaxID=1746091 RepID=A0ABQ8YQ84_9EUKA|nr:p17/29c-like protein [Anaeramoeba flamelloides]